MDTRLSCHAHIYIYLHPTYLEVPVCCKVRVVVADVDVLQSTDSTNLKNVVLASFEIVNAAHVKSAQMCGGANGDTQQHSRRPWLLR